MKRTILDTVFVAGRTKKWRGALPGFDLARLRLQAGVDRLPRHPWDGALRRPATDARTPTCSGA